MCKDVDASDDTETTNKSQNTSTTRHKHKMKHHKSQKQHDNHVTNESDIANDNQIESTYETQNENRNNIPNDSIELEATQQFNNQEEYRTQRIIQLADSCSKFTDRPNSSTNSPDPVYANKVRIRNSSDQPFDDNCGKSRNYSSFIHHSSYNDSDDSDDVKSDEIQYDESLSISNHFKLPNNIANTHHTHESHSENRPVSQNLLLKTVEEKQPHPNSMIFNPNHSSESES